MRKLVQHQIPAIRRIRRDPFRGVPRENNPSQPVLGVAKQMLFSRFPDRPLKMPLSMSNVGRWINKDGAQFRVIVRLSMKEEKTRLAGNRKTDLVSQVE